MKRTFLRNFKQIYVDPHTNEKKEYKYQVAIIKDTEDYKYRILNVTSGTIWKQYAFRTFDDALKFINNHPHAIKENEPKEVILGRFY